MALFRNVKISSSRDSFTLIEIIIVVVILGVLAAVALPRIAGNTAVARAAEAFTFSERIGKAFYRCIDNELPGALPTTAAEVTACDDYNELGIIDPSTGSLPAATTVLITGDSFTYNMWVWDVPDLFIEIIPKLKAQFDGDQVNDAMNIRYHADGRSEKFWCGGKFSKVCKN